MRVLITGVTGFVGSHMAEYVLREHPEAEVFGTLRWRSRMENIEAIKRQVTLVDCDLKDGVSVQKMLEEARPDRVFHLAAQSFVPASWHAPSDTVMTNVMGQINLFEGARALGLSPRIQIAGSSEEYGLVHEDELPIRETNPLRPLSPYAVSKVSQDYFGYQYFMSYGLPVVRTRAFNHSGPRRGDVFVESNFAKQVVEIELGQVPPVLKVGNLEARRDFTDVRDVVRAYWLALERGEPGEVYNICSGKAYTIQWVLDRLLAASSAKITVQQDPERMRPSDVPVLLGDASKFAARTGWAPVIPFEQTLQDILDYWRQQLGAPIPAGRK